LDLGEILHKNTILNTLKQLKLSNFDNFLLIIKTQTHALQSFIIPPTFLRQNDRKSTYIRTKLTDESFFL